MEGNEYVEGKDKHELLKSLYKGSQVGSKVHEQQKMAIWVRCTEDIEKSIKDFTNSSNKLSKHILWLNIILGVFTIVGTILAVMQIFKD